MPEFSAEASIVIDASRQRVWRALTDPNVIPNYYLGATVSTDWQVGSPIIWAGEWRGTPYEDKGEILVFEPEEELSYSHWSPLSGTDDHRQNYHVVDIRLRDTDGATEVTLTQHNLAGGVTDADRAQREDYDKNWATMLEGLKSTVEA